MRDQLIARGITNPRLLEAMGELPRELFVSPRWRDQAYEDGPLPIGSEQTISQPYVVALMTQCLELTGKETVLEVGAGSGYQTAILAKLARHVYSVEKYSGLAARAQAVLESLEIENVEITVGDGSVGWVERAPFDGIIVTAAAPAMPAPLLSQLRARGRIVIPIGSRYDQYLEVWQKRGDAWHIEKSLPVRFVPLVGEWGWGN